MHTRGNPVVIIGLIQEPGATIERHNLTLGFKAETPLSPNPLNTYDILVEMTEA